MKNFKKQLILLVSAIILTASISHASDFDPLGSLGAGGGSQNPNPEVYDMDALTNGTDTPQPEPTPQPKPTNESTTPSPSENNDDEFSLTLAECLIMEKLEIEDKRCDKLKQALSCPEYTQSIQECTDAKNACLLKNIKGESGILAYDCRNQYTSCLIASNNDYPKCSEEYPVDEFLLPQKLIEISDSTGKVKVTYKDNPTASDFREVAPMVPILLGATVYTEDNSSVNLEFSENSTAYIGPNSYFRIDDFYVSDKLEQGNMFLKEGSVRVLINQKSNDKGTKFSYVIMTPLLKVKAKGTEFLVTVNENGAVEVETISGEVEVFDLDENFLDTVEDDDKYQSENLIDESSTTEVYDKDTSSSYSLEIFIDDQTALGLGILGAVLLIGGLIFFILKRKKK